MTKDELETRILQLGKHLDDAIKKSKEENPYVIIAAFASGIARLSMLIAEHEDE
jgi:hypothetical protein